MKTPLLIVAGVLVFVCGLVFASVQSVPKTVGLSAEELAKAAADKEAAATGEYNGAPDQVGDQDTVGDPPPGVTAPKAAPKAAPAPSWVSGRVVLDTLACNAFDKITVAVTYQSKVDSRGNLQLRNVKVASTPTTICPDGSDYYGVTPIEGLDGYQDFESYENSGYSDPGVVETSELNRAFLLCYGKKRYESYNEDGSIQDLAGCDGQDRTIGVAFSSEYEPEVIEYN